ncbi:MAG TPA: MFS transporter, partial [Chloroflexota bacterium]|nr:MFS transporter [Chloroflexota bacterium]
MSHDTNRKAVTVAVLTATFLAALDTSVVGTAMPSIIGALGGLALYSWAFSAYLLTSTTTVPVCGRLSDIYGRKPVFLVGAALFLVGSALCGTSSSMEQLILYRALQGLGAGAVLPVSLTVVGDIYSLQDRAKIQGLISGVRGVSAILGPIIGAVLVEQLDWRWVFYVNIPFGLLSMLLFALFLSERGATQNATVDIIGSIVMTASVALLMLGLLELGQDGSSLSLPAWPLLGAAVGL